MMVSMASMKARATWRSGWLWAATLAALVVLGLLVVGALPILLGYDTYVASGGSMEPAVRKGSIVVAKRVDPATIQAGDIITFTRPQRPDLQVTHRVVAVQEENGNPVFLTKGDANNFVDPGVVRVSQPISKMAYSVPFVGYVVAFGWSGPGKLLLIGLPALLLLVLSVPRVRRWPSRSGRAGPASPSPAMRDTRDRLGSTGVR